MKIIALETRRVAQEKPYLPQVLIIQGRVYDTEELPADVVHKVLKRGFCEKHVGAITSTVETPDDNAALDIHKAFIASGEDLDDNTGEDLDDVDVEDDVDAEGNEADVKNEETAEVKEAAEVKESEEPVAEKQQTAKKIIRRKN